MKKYNKIVGGLTKMVDQLEALEARQLVKAQELKSQLRDAEEEGLAAGKTKDKLKALLS